MLICVVIPDFAIQIERQNTSTLAPAPLVLYAVRGQKRVVYAVCADAKAKGIMLGMTRSRVRALCPDIQEMMATPKQYLRASDNICELLLHFSDRIEKEQDHALTLWLDCGNISLEEAKQRGNEIMALVSQRFSFQPQIGITNGRSSARLAALLTRRNTIRTVAINADSTFLLALPVKYFALGDPLLKQFKQLGITTLAHLASLPYNAVRSRFGQRGALLHRLANGYDRHTLSPYELPQHESTTQLFETPIEDRLIVEAALKQIAHGLSQILLQKNLACSDITLTVSCERAQIVETSRILRQPVQDFTALYKELTRLFSQLRLNSGVLQIAVLLDSLSTPSPTQLDFFNDLFGKPSTSVEDLSKRLTPRHGDAPFRRLLLTRETTYLSERKVLHEIIGAA